MFRDQNRLLAAATAALLLFTVARVPAAFAQPDTTLAGTWLGSLRAGPVELRLVFNVTVDSLGALQATLDSPDQGANGIPVASVSLERDSVMITVPVIGGRYDGTLAQGGDSIDGSWSQAGQSFPLDVKRTETGVVLVRPQEPKPPFPYVSEEVTIRHPDGHTLAGTLTLPEGAGPHPAVVLVTGSGPQDRNESLMGHKPFLVLADYLTRQGIAVLRHDDRGVGESTGEFQSATTVDFASDARAALDFLREREEIDAEHVGLIGHSEGGLSAPMVALDAPEAVDFLVLLAPPGIPGDEILYLQDSLIAAASGTSDELIQIARERKDMMFPVIRSVESASARADSLRAVMNAMTLSDEERAYYDSTGTSVETLVNRQIAIMSTDWFRFFMMYDPAPALRKLDVPVLAVIGEKDLQVPAEQNIPALEAALAASDSEDYLVRELPGLNHLFQHADTGHINEYSRIEETFAPEALEMIGAWILGHVRE